MVRLVFKCHLLSIRNYADKKPLIETRANTIFTIGIEMCRKIQVQFDREKRNIPNTLKFTRAIK